MMLVSYRLRDADAARHVRMMHDSEAEEKK
jgi:hypothetical protein